ncbi:MAG: hypothetical protein IJO74_01110 [Clostridia bacterium]|nr:hypothetical protein [Clostridia bacterium]
MYSFSKKIHSYELCHNGTLKLSYLMRYMQTAACLDIQDKGMSYEFLREHNIVFVITRLKIQLDETFNNNDDIKIESWPKGVKGLTFIRDFVISKNGKAVGYASTQWVLMNFEKRCPVRATSLPRALPDQTHPLNRDIEFEHHILPPETAVFCGTYDRKIMLSDLDENLHINNTNYADIMLDFLPEQYHKNIFKGIQINYRGEARLGDELRVSVFSDNDTVYYTAENLTKGSTCFEGKLF